MAKQRAGERVIESRVFEEVMEPRQGEDHHRVGKVNQGGKPPRVWKTLLRVIHSIDNSTGHGFSSTTINLGVIEVFKMSQFEFIWKQEICKKNKDNRNKQVIPHTGGSKPILRRRHEMWQQKYTNLESQVQTTLGALKAYMIMKEGKIPDELVVFFDPQPQGGLKPLQYIRHKLKRVVTPTKTSGTNAGFKSLQ
ncbi:hypothetical protein Fmac_005308 [Flemingia macrophylla]|uniref:Uncharacterized protein n=1 Tax=Flemingia macrophylla TaxID=520843 RepID=A0ABD1N7D6_9FABA